ncbi:MAG TPA: hypothetical protein VG293_05470 [Solirubrobacteraceae bacterium]|nr:hypothetical protein [Solirubrobacteraceae bacterium]
MKTRAQQSRDAALRRLTRINRSLAVAAMVGAGVITDVVANTASGHTRTGAGASSSTTAGYKPALLVSGTGATGNSAARRAAAARAAARYRAAARLRAAKHSKAESLQTSSAPSTATQSSSSSSSASPSSSSSSVSSASSAPAVVAVSGGS